MKKKVFLAFCPYCQRRLAENPTDEFEFFCPQHGEIDPDNVDMVDAEEIKWASHPRV